MSSAVFVLYDSCSSSTMYQHPGYQQHAFCGVPQWVRVAWLLLASSPFRAPWPIKGQHSHPMMHREVKSFPVKRCCRTYTRLGWYCYSALLYPSEGHPPNDSTHRSPVMRRFDVPVSFVVHCLFSLLLARKYGGTNHRLAGDSTPESLVMHIFDMPFVVGPNKLWNKQTLVELSVIYFAMTLIWRHNKNIIAKRYCLTTYSHSCIKNTLLQIE